METNKTIIMTLEQVKTLANNFLTVADELEEMVSDYLNGSNDIKAVNAYMTVKDADKRFVDAVNSYYGSNEYQYGMNYDLAESFFE